ncbi:Spc98 family-domain-containing protein [Phellopilus nigrolimitatus]|nr:Spc98 family-domain-containing protein [Phellopilus nigrolimitatus]
MIAEILLVLTGHSSSLFPEDSNIHPDFVPLLHPGERQCLESLGLIAFRYRTIKAACSRLSQSPSRYICAFCSKLNEILKDEYESLVVETEAKILNRDDDYVGQGSFVPLSAIRATFAEWDNPLAALEFLMSRLEEAPSWPAGSLVDLLLARSETGIHRVSSIMSRLAEAVQRIWRTQLQAFVVHGSLSSNEPLATSDYVLDDNAIPSCVSGSARESIAYIGRAIGTVKALKWHNQIPSSLSLNHSRLLDTVLPQDQHAFERVIAQIRADISEWLWSNVLTMHDVEDAVDSLANYFLLQNGEFSLSLIREIDRLKQSRLTARSGPSTIIREQDLHLALLRASLGTTAQYDPNLSRLRFQLPTGPVRPLLPSYAEHSVPTLSSSRNVTEQTRFDDILLGTPLKMTYGISWPLDLFLHTSDLTTYADLFSFLSSLRHVHTRIHTCWTSLSNAQRARRRWTGLDEGGTADLEARKELLRCGWGVVRLMGWFMDVLLGYMMIDVVETEFQRLKALLKSKETTARSRSSSMLHPSSSVASQNITASASKDSIGSTSSQNLDFTTLRILHTTYLEHLLSASLLTQPALTATIRSIFEVCEQFMGLVERWGGDVLPALLIEGSIAGGGSDSVGRLVKERQEIVKDIDQNIKILLETFYEQLSTTTSQPLNVGDGSKSILMNATVANFSSVLLNTSRAKSRVERDGDTRRHIERLLLRLDFNRMFSKPGFGEVLGPAESMGILKEGGLA